MDNVSATMNSGGLLRKYPIAIYIFIGLVTLLIASIIILSSVPPVSRDALTHHLAVPKLYLQHGGIYEIPSIEFSYYPMNLDLLYLVPLYFGNDIIHVFVRNQGLCDEWEYINEMPEFQSAIDDYNFMIMDFPKFPFWERNMIDRLGITFDMAIAHPELKVIPKQRVKNFLKKAYASLAATELIQ